jgi:hypothetical protein
MTETTTETTTPEPQSLDAGTEYVVLVRDSARIDAGGPDVDPIRPAPFKRWNEIGTANARSADAAIREVVGKQPENERGGQFVAIPARSFKPVTVSEKVERTLVIGS